MGFKEYVPDLVKYRVDGRTLLLLDTCDYPSININTRLHIRRIQVEIDKRWPPWKREEINSIHLIRREKLKRQGELEAAAIEIQRVYRGHLGRKDAKNEQEVRRVLAIKKNYDSHVDKAKIWWLERINEPPPGSQLPKTPGEQLKAVPVKSKLLTPAKQEPSTHQSHQSISEPNPALASFPIGIPTAPPIPSYPLPPIKNFGKKRTYLSCKGWGGFTTDSDGHDVWKPMSILGNAEAEVIAPPIVYRDTHVTTYFTEKLTKTGYDRNREERRAQNHKPLMFRNKEKELEFQKKKNKEQSLAKF